MRGIVAVYEYMYGDCARTRLGRHAGRRPSSKQQAAQLASDGTLVTAGHAPALLVPSRFIYGYRNLAHTLQLLQPLRTLGSLRGGSNHRSRTVGCAGAFLVPFTFSRPTIVTFRDIMRGRGHDHAIHAGGARGD